MNKIPSDPRLPMLDNVSQLRLRLHDILQKIAIAHNDSYYWETNGTAAPTSGTWANGDKCRNNSPSELGSAGSKYVVTGWIYISGSWLEMRVLTGN